MKKLLVLFILFSSTVSFAQRERKSLSTEAFTSIEASGAITIYMRQGTAYDVTAVGEEEDIDRIKYNVSGSTLTLEYSGSIHSLTSSNDLVVYVTVKDISSIHLSGAVELEGKNTLDIERLKIQTEGATELSLMLDINMLDIHTSGASEIELEGSGNLVKISSSGASELDAEEFVAKKMNISLSGAAEADVHVEEVFIVEASGASEITYSGNPTIESDLSGASSLTKR